MNGVKKIIGIVSAAACLLLWASLSASAGEIPPPLPTPYSMDFYREIAEAFPGDVVTVHDSQGTRCGAFTVVREGKYGFLHVYGDDTATPADEGAKLQEPLQFRLNGAPLSPLTGGPILWLGDGQRMRVDFRR